jgi:tetratricopeptide (TPR) repeat protein
MAELKKAPAEDASELAGRGKAMSTKGLDLIISGIIYLVFFLSPLFFSGLVAQGLGFEKMVLFYFLVLLGIVAWVTKGVIAGELNIKRTPLDIPIIALIAAFSLSTIFSISVKDSLVGSYGASAKGLFALLILVLFYYLAVNNITRKSIKNIFAAIIFSGFLLVIFEILQLSQIYLLPFDFAQSQAFNPLGSLSGLTAYLVMLLPIFVVAATKAGDIYAGNKIAAMGIKVLSLLSAIGVMLVLAMLNGFTFWPVAIVGAVIVLMFFLSKIIKVSSNNIIIPLVTFVALIIFLVLGTFRVMDLQLPAEVSLSRQASWNIAKAAMAENPIFGSGPGTFYYSFSKFKSLDFNSSPLWNVRFDSASGALFEMAATVGAAGTLAFIILVLIALSVSFLSLVKSEDKEIDAIQLALFASFVAALLFALLFAQNNSLILLIGLISILTVSVSLVMFPEKFSMLKLSFRASPKYALALAAIFLCVSAGVVILFTMGLKMYMADINARKALLAGDPAAKIESLRRSIELAPYQDSYFLSLANNYMALANQAALSGADQNQVSANLALAIESGKNAVNISENKVQNKESLALIYENASFYTRGALEWAEKLYKDVMDLDPNNPTPYLRTALVNMARANAESDNEEKKFYINEAIKKYDEAIAKKMDIAAAFYGKAIAYEKLGDLDNAIENLKQANIQSRDNLDYRFELGRLYFNKGVSQLSLSQTASQQIAINDIDPDFVATGTEQQLTVPPAAPGPQVDKNQDLLAAEQLFLSILAANPNHANSRYSLAVLYQKVGDTDKARLMAEALLNIIEDAQTAEAVRSQFSDIL